MEVRLPAFEVAESVAEPQRSVPLIVRLPCGVCLEVAVGTDPQWLGSVLRALRAVR